MIEIDGISVADSKPILVLTPEQERLLRGACDEWQFPLFLTLLFTGMRPGELVHSLLPDNLDVETDLSATN